VYTDGEPQLYDEQVVTKVKVVLWFLKLILLDEHGKDNIYFKLPRQTSCGN
jgi:hypothetical protein